MAFCLAVVLAGCSIHGIPVERHECKYRAYLDSDLGIYLNAREYNGIPVRVAVVPFDVPEAFAADPSRDDRLGVDLARSFVRELLSAGTTGVIELFDVEHWQGKREDFFTGNYEAMRLARDAGYGFLALGYLDEVKNSHELKFFLKTIDVTKNMTLTYHEFTIESDKAWERTVLEEASLIREQPGRADFEGRLEKFNSCAVKQLLKLSE